ncbi:MAG: nucleotidyltransferase domain-containing protein [Candidatus Bathyarchaeota archaeon]|nr:nucleotidyltransferase domain-containing protein [Candidatus Bathyarchaeota archaeon]MDH5733350.1 nucleotidyltransferase domain-containing protein [Candidatus Bathyarchaeota archaeon]
MVARKPLKRAERIEVIYSEKHWDLLKELRVKAMKIMESLNQFHLYSIVHGSIVRGDVSQKSDIDIFVPDPPSSFTIETSLERAGVSVNRRLVVQATPHFAVKGYLEIDNQECVSFPLLKLRPIERDFYKFGGEASFPMLKKGTRVLGVDKRLMLIEPTKKGHIESTIVGQEENIAGVLGISVETVLDRVHALLRRDEIGRTGVFIERELSPEETFEMVLKKLVDQNPAVRRRLKLYGR